MISAAPCLWCVTNEVSFGKISAAGSSLGTLAWPAWAASERDEVLSA